MVWGTGSGFKKAAPPSSCMRLAWTLSMPPSAPFAAAFEKQGDPRSGMPHTFESNRELIFTEKMLWAEEFGYCPHSNMRSPIVFMEIRSCVQFYWPHWEES